MAAVDTAAEMRPVPVAPAAHPPEPVPIVIRRRPAFVIYAVIISALALFLVLLTMLNQRTPYTSEAVLDAPVIGIAQEKPIWPPVSPPYQRVIWSSAMLGMPA